jgi:hypothetical protein
MMRGCALVWGTYVGLSSHSGEIDTNLREVDLLGEHSELISMRSSVIWRCFTKEGVMKFEWVVEMAMQSE